MSAITASIDRSTFLRRVLLVDAATCVATGMLLWLAEGLLSALLELPGVLLKYSGLSLLPIAAFMILVATRATLPRAGAWLIIAGNALWVVASALVLVLSSPSALGYAFVTAQAAAVALLAGLEVVGVRRL